MSYTNDPANSITDRIRLMVGDTEECEEGLSDEVYQYIVDKHTVDGVVDEQQAALEALKALVAKYANYVTEKAGGLFIKASEKYKQYRDLLDSWIRDPSYGFMRVGSGFAGGIYLDDMKSNRQNPNANLNPFHIGQKSSLSNEEY